MAGVVNPISPDVATYKGLGAIFEYRNADGRLKGTNCGQAAACTMLTYRGKMTRVATAPNTNMLALETTYPPDNAGGIFGTSRKQVEAIFKAYSLKVATVSGKADLKTAIQNSKPVAVVTSVHFASMPVSVPLLGSTPYILSKEIPSAHWMVAYGYDKDKVYLSNYGSMTWDEFTRRWDSIICKAIDMQSKGLVATNT